jgi:hypothetical protein
MRRNIDTESNDRQSLYAIEVLDLNSPRLREWRMVWMTIFELASQHDRGLLLRVAGFPDELDDLSVLAPPFNTRPAGILESSFARRYRGELPETY